jgi:hypothetical protein
MGNTPHYNFIIPEVGDPGWGPIINKAVCDIDNKFYDVVTEIDNAHGGFSTLSGHLSDIDTEIDNARNSDAFGVDYNRLTNHFDEIDQQIQYAKGPYTTAGLEELRDAIAMGDNESVGNSYIGNTEDTDDTTTENIVFHPSGISVNPGSGISYFNINGKIYSVTATITGACAQNGFVVVEPVSDDVGIYSLIVSMKNGTEVQALSDSQVPIGWGNTTGDIHATFAKNKRYVYIKGGTISPASSDDVVAVAAVTGVNLGWAPDEVTVVAKYQTAGGLTRYAINPPSIQVTLTGSGTSPEYVNGMTIKARKVIHPLRGDVAYDGANRVLHYDATAAEDINTFTDLKVVLSYWGTPWKDNRKSF